jgi:hypothetical protein
MPYLLLKRLKFNTGRDIQVTEILMYYNSIS